MYFAYLSGAYNANNVVLYYVPFIAYCYILYGLYHVDIGNVLQEKIQTIPAALR